MSKIVDCMDVRVLWTSDAAAVAPARPDEDGYSRCELYRP